MCSENRPNAKPETVMKHILHILLLFGLFSCGKVEDHYRIKGITIQVGEVSTGPNSQCINIGNKSDSSYNDLIGIQIEFIREYYSTDSSRSSGIMYSPRGWEGCSEKISKLDLTAESININNLLFGDTLITGVDKDELTSFRCQEKYGCDCRNALSIPSIDLLVSSFNNQHKTGTRMFISEKYDETPFIFFVDKSELKPLKAKRIKIQVEMSNGDILTGKSNKIQLKD